MDTAIRNYLLVIKTGNNSYLPIEWESISSYNKENIYSLEGIDNFTSRFNESQLLSEAVEQNIISLTDPYRNIAIIFKENGKNREVKEGVIFKDSYNILTEDELLDVLFDAINNNDKETINNILMQCKIKEQNQELDKFMYVLKNSNIFKEKGEKGIKAALSLYYNMPYEIRRKIRIKISKKVIFK